MSKAKASRSKNIASSRRQRLQSPLFFGVVLFIAALSIVVLGSWAIRAVIDSNNQARLERIEAIYASLELDDDQYRMTSTNVFGEKRAYDWDAGRSYSSSVEYVHGDTVTNTVNALDEKIKAAGFTRIDEPYPGMLAEKQYHYKSENGAYIRLKVSSKMYEDAAFNASVMNESIPAAVDQDPAELDKAPAVVTIKVNLDNNNE